MRNDAPIGAGVPGVLGIHIEGPFLNPSRKGIHDEPQFRHLGITPLPPRCASRSPPRGRKYSCW